MKYQDVKISALKSWGDCYDAIQAIESDWRNVKGGFKAWNSGRNTFLLKSAERKIALIENRMEGFVSHEDSEG